MNKYEQISMLEEIGGIKPLNNSSYTYKSSNLIMSSYELSVTQQRIIMLGCKKIQPIYIENRLAPNDLTKVLGAMKFSLIEISVSEYKKEYNIKGNNIYDYIEKETNDLYEAGFYYFDKNNKLCKRRWVSSCDFDRENGKIYLTFNIDIILDLLVLKGNFVALLFDLSQDIRSRYTFRIYEILKSIVYLGDWTVSIEEFKFLLAITDKYGDFANLNKKVIKPNIKLINDFSDIMISEYETIRSGRNIKWLKFKVRKKYSTKSVPNNDFKNSIPSAFNEVSNALRKYKIELTSKDAQTLFNLAIEITKERYKDTNPVKFIMEKIKILDNYVQSKDSYNPIGFLISAMENEFKQQIIPKQPKENSFNNFEPRAIYNDELAMDKLERRLLGWDKDDTDNNK